MKTTCLCAILVFFVCGFGVALNGVGQISPGEIKIKVDGKPVELQRRIIERTKVAFPSIDGDVKSLVRHYELDRKPEKNPQLVFGVDEIKYWTGKKLDKKTLKLEFAARKIILDAADKQNVAIRDQDMLSVAAREVIPFLQEDRPPNVPCLICPCEGGGGDTSQKLIKKAWNALDSNKGGMDPKNFERALACTKVTIDKYAGDADEQQAMRLQNKECKTIPKKDQADTYFASYWALSDVAAAWFIRGQVFEQQKNCEEAKEAYKIIIAKYNCAYIWDPEGWFWNAAKGAEQALKNLETYGCTGTVQ